ncbi:LOW QUALITY PROTEIN: hypothetical protein QYF61_004670 [Mycteria americana]|uniref:Uncharacterized protein n=1 Tax=Mycteria americana TaxID=33587 RepID=A0AAN7NQ00_MYCAM|nr:LOW QUALITY PROTEIN: hypothetical protein QYF61_004670 [Mycteria americana]
MNEEFCNQAVVADGLLPWLAHTSAPFSFRQPSAMQPLAVMSVPRPPPAVGWGRESEEHKFRRWVNHGAAAAAGYWGDVFISSREPLERGRRKLGLSGATRFKKKEMLQKYVLGPQGALVYAGGDFQQCCQGLCVSSVCGVNLALPGSVDKVGIEGRVIAQELRSRLRRQRDELAALLDKLMQKVIHSAQTTTCHFALTPTSMGSRNLEKRRLGGAELINVYKYLKGGCKEDRARLFSVVPSDRTRDNTPQLKHGRFCLNIRKHFFTGDKALEQVAQGGCGVSILGHIQKPSGPEPGQPDLEKYLYLNKLDIHKSIGPDALLPQELANVIERPLSIIFGKLQQSAELPEDWNKANVASIFRKCKKDHLGNYRPASLTSLDQTVVISDMKASGGQSLVVYPRN